ncbi:DNA-binding transcriptional regulator GbsR (MarR family) [Salibacterium salarium]|uniref:choline uptake/conversion transcriptional regulator CudC n=1 Tax=Salibacterium salarium TaxID=284579 RepID=UPI00278222CD|nr:GbsR/MarR family transcriptional regulator [Salibacterium salarium]MDQ0299955.1 DNA-binding transcriptional regulator GbsR (MarR family) [Salibacterium salarium]
MSNSSDQEARESLDNAKELVIDSIAETMDLYGVTRSAGTLYGTMYLEGDMTLDEMREKLGMSKPSMSTGVKKLQEFNVVKKTFRKGKRKQTYIAEKDFFQFFSNFFTQKWEREAKVNLHSIKDAQSTLTQIINEDNVSEEVKEDARETFQVMENSKRYYQWLNKLVETIETGEIFDLIPLDSKDEDRQ